MSIRTTSITLVVLILSACCNKEPHAIVTPVTSEMEVEWRAE